METIEIVVNENIDLVEINVAEPNSIIAIEETAQTEIENLDSTESNRFVSVRRFWQGLIRFLNRVNAFTKQQYFSLSTLSDAANIAWNVEGSQVAQVTLGGNRTLSNPTNIKEGATYILYIIQDATGGRTLSFGTNYKFPNGVAPILTTNANAVDILTCVSRAGLLHCVLSKNFK